jgi:hypothetical protein
LGHLSGRRGDKVSSLRQRLRRFPHPSIDLDPDYLALLTDDLGMDLLSEQWNRSQESPYRSALQPLSQIATDECVSIRWKAVPRWRESMSGEIDYGEN